jgi:uncharacterized protein YndB with AHSA1/START domain
MTMRYWQTMIGVVLVAAGVGAAQAVQEETKMPPTATAGAQTPPAVWEAIINAPPAEVWKVFSTGEGFKKLGVAKAEVDLRPGGLIRTHYSPEGVLGDEGTIQNQIMAFEPERMIAFRIFQPPKGFPFKEAWKKTWSVATFTDLGDRRTNLRLAMQGFGTDEESLAMREFFVKGNEWTMKKLQAGFDSAVKPSAAASAHEGGPLDPIEIQTVVAAPKDEVWKAYTTSAGWKAFAGLETRIGSKPGEPFEIYFGSDAPVGERGSEGCTILSLVPGEMFSYSWNAPPKFPHARAERTWIVVTFEPISGSATRVRVRHMGFAEQAAAHADQKGEWEETRAYFVQAWPKVLGALTEHFSPSKQPARGMATPAAR